MKIDENHIKLEWRDKTSVTVSYDGLDCGLVVWDGYSGCFRQSGDSYKREFGTQQSAVLALIEDALQNLEK